MLVAESSRGLDNHELPTTNGQFEGVGLENTLCPGCKNSAVSENGGLVVAFGQSFFHVDCFKCAKCGDKVTADTNLLLLSDGSPICANCSYSCNVCHLPILDEAIMTGDDAYHAHCFKCKVCKSRIDELVFAKTSQGIYCMNCHNERMIKVRKHAQKKAERDRERAANGGSHSSRSRDRNQNTDQPNHQLKSMPSHSSIHSHNPSGTPSINRRPSLSRPSPSQSSFPNSPQPPVPPPIPDIKSRDDVLAYTDPERTPVPPRIRTPQNGSVPLDTLPQNGITGGPVEGLRITPNKRSKRHSINPGLVLAPASAEAVKKPTNPPTLSPNSAFSTFNVAQQQSPVPLSSAGRDSPRVPLREQFPSHGVSPALSRPSSRSSHREASFPLTPPPYDSHQFSNDASRSRTVSAGASTPNEDQPRPPLRPTLTVDSVPQTRPEGTGGNVSPDITVNGSVIRHQHSFDERRHSGPRSKHRLSSTPSLSILDERSRSRSTSPRPGSPMHQVDVPHSVESGTDTEDSKQSSDEAPDIVSPPPLPPKNLQSPSTSATLSPLSPEADQAESSEDIELESNRVERVSHSTFIAPALPPIRFSMSGADFSELLTSVGGLPPLKQLEQMALHKVAEEPGQVPATAPTAAAASEPGDSPRSDVTIFFGEGEVTSPRANGRKSLDSAQDAQHKVPPLPKRSKTTESPYNRPTDLESSFSLDSYGTSATPNSKSATTLVRSKSEARGSPKTHRRLPSNASARSQSESAQTHTTLIETGAGGVTTGKRPDTSDLVLRRLREAIVDANERGAQQLKLDRGFIEAIIQQMEHKSTQFLELKGSLDGIKRASKQYQDGLTVAQAEYDRELKARRDAEAEVTRLRVLLSGQAVRLTALSGDTRKQQLKEQLTKDMNESLSGLEQDLSKLKVARDMTLAEVEELSASKSAPEVAPPTGLSRSLTTRLEKIRGQYEQELIPLKQQREALVREIAELKSARDIILEETTVLSARNEELAQLTSQYARRIDTLPENATYKPRQSSIDKYRSPTQPSHQPTASVPALGMNPSFNSSTASITPLSDESMEPAKSVKVIKLEAEVATTSKPKFKWPGTRTKETLPSVAETSHKVGRTLEHAFQQVSVLRFTKCDHCGETLWGSQLRCNACHISIHNRCLQHVNGSCHPRASKDELSNDTQPPSMFGRNLIEQVQADSTIMGAERNVPVLVEKCIEAVEASALEYEGIYRKTGGSGQSKAITSLFERGNYNAFDLRDSDRFNDICSVTSVLKTYFRSLPVPLFTFDLHDGFMSAVHVRDAAAKETQLRDLINQLPTEHYYTLKMLMLHLNRISERSEVNLMNARNLGVVFGPTLMRSQDPNAEFGDMAGKALSVEWLVENAPSVFTR